jgi:hypothetical protein
MHIHGPREVKLRLQCVENGGRLERWRSRLASQLEEAMIFQVVVPWSSTQSFPVPHTWSRLISMLTCALTCFQLINSLLWKQLAHFLFTKAHHWTITSVSSLHTKFCMYFLTLLACYMLQASHSFFYHLRVLEEDHKFGSSSLCKFVNLRLR